MHSRFTSGPRALVFPGDAKKAAANPPDSRFPIFRTPGRLAMRTTSKAFILFPLLAAACGSGAGPDYNRSFATLHGSIAGSSVQTTSEVRVALVWEHVNTEPGVTALKSTQELGLRAQFPSNFQMDINALPPKEALSQMDPAKAATAGIDPNLRMAAGTLVVYEDSNGNGKLDLLTVDSK